MATLSSDKKYVTVTKGDTLSQIAKTYKSYTGGASYQKLADWNSISNPNKIYVGQKIYLSKSGASSSSSSSSNTNCATNLTLGLLADSDNELLATWSWSKESTTDNYQLVWSYNTFDNKWLVGSDTSNSVNEYYRAASRQSTYTIPDNAKQVRFKVKPIAKKKKDSKGQETSTYQWTANWTDWKTYTVSKPLAAPSAPGVEMSGLKLTSTLEDIDTYGTQVQFQIVKNNTTTVKTSDKIKINSFDYVSWSYIVTAGNKYKVRAKVIGSGLESDWSDFSDEIEAYPTAPSKITTCKEYAELSGVSDYSVYLAWSKVSSATSYKIQYATKKELFDQTDQVETVTVESQSTVNPTPPTAWVISGLSAGEYFFRVCASNDGGDSTWTDIVSLTLGEKPGNPTSWSSTTKAVVGETIKLYWVHNSLDGSTQRYCGFNITVGGTVLAIQDAIANSPDTDTTPVKLLYSYPSSNSYFRVYRIYSYEEETTQLYAELDTGSFSSDAKIQWQVRTAGLTKEFGDYSTLREIDVYDKPELDLMVTNDFTVNEDGSITLPDSDTETVKMDVLESFPFYVKAVSTPITQIPLGYRLTISTLDSYETVDQVGNTQTISVGDEVYSQNFDISTDLLVEISAGNVDLESGVRYSIKCVVSLNSGLSAEASSEFLVSWSDEHYTPNAEYTLDADTYSLSIRPYCEEYTTMIKAVEKTSDGYSVTDSVLGEESLENVYTTSGDRVLLGINTKGKEIYYCIVLDNDEPVYYSVIDNGDGTYATKSKLATSTVSKRYTTTNEEVNLGIVSNSETLYSSVEEGTLVDNVSLSVYRREFDGSFTEIATDLNNLNNTFVTDPHPALDYGRYRIVAKSNTTGAISYYDPPGFDIGGKAIIIQWDEEWSSFDGWSEDPLAEPPWTGSLLTLPYNIDVSDTTSPEVSLISYIGRKHPVSYYGTQLGETASWNVSVPKEDDETLYQLRRLKVWMGDVYVREPSGTGYWAHVTVSDPRKHNEVTVSVTIDITRVEGGI